jgi:hypothetical protein
MSAGESSVRYRDSLSGYYGRDEDDRMSCNGGSPGTSSSSCDD